MGPSGKWWLVRESFPTIREWRDRLTASDPGLNRLRMARNGVVAMASTLGVEWLFTHAVGADAKSSLIALLLGAVLAMMGSMGLSASTARVNATTALCFPLAIGAGLTLGAAVAPHHDLLLAVFVVVMFAAVFVRRFGVPFFIYGFMGWMGYFFASFLGASFGQLPMLLADVTLAAAWVLLLSVSVLRPRPARTLRRTLRAFGARGRAVAEASYDVVSLPPSARRAQFLQSRASRLTESALMVEGQLAEQAALPAGWSATRLRQWLVDAELATQGLALAASGLSGAAGPGVADLRASVLSVLRPLADENYPAARRAATALLAACADRDEWLAEHRHQANHLAGAALDFLDSARNFSDVQPESAAAMTAADEDFEPAVTLMMGNLPSSAKTAGDVAPRGAHGHLLAGLSLTTRQAIQVALAGGLAIAAGRALSEQRYYWAVIAAFVTFSGTATRSETAIKATNRVVGTLAGLGVAIVLAHLTPGDTDAVLAVILISVFLGFYLFRISYAFMIFFITIMVAQLYGVLHEFTNHLLVLRLEETAIGAAIGIAVGLFVLPVSTRDTARAAGGQFYGALRELLEGAARRLDGEPDSANLDGLTRAVDAALHQLIQVMRPLTRALLPGSDRAVVQRQIGLSSAAATYAGTVASALRWLVLGESDRDAAALATACRALATACAQLGEDGPRGADDDDVARCLSAARQALDNLSGLGRGSGTGAVAHGLARLHEVLRQLAGIPGGDVAAVRAGDVAVSEQPAPATA